MAPPEVGAIAHDADEVEDTPWVDLSRLVSLSDGIFAFAMTLLVLDLTVPSFLPGPEPANLEGWLGGQLQSDWGQFLGYAFAFTMIAIWWIAHQKLFLRLRRADRRFQWLNLLFLLAIAATPFVLRLLVTDDYATTFLGAGVFLAAEGLTSLLMTGMWFYATDGHRLVDPSLSQAAIWRGRWDSLTRTAIFGAAFAIALVRPTWGLFALSALYVNQFVRGARRKRGRSLPPSSPASAGGPTA